MKHFSIFIRAILMGICDVIPGISGGTIAFITGIYERLMNWINNLIPAVILFFRGKFKKSVKLFDFHFSIPLVLGLIIAIIGGSYLIDYLLVNFQSFTLSFFVGLILVSSLFIFKHIKSHKKSDVSFGFIGLIIGLILAFISPTSVTLTYPLIFIAGFLTIFGMFLPGVSGSFILLLMGMYVHSLNALHSFDLTYIGIFLLGAILGAIVIAKIVTFLLNNFHSKTLYLLLGLVFGALLVPIKRIDFNLLSIIFIVLGAGISYLVSRHSVR